MESPESRLRLPGGSAQEVAEVAVRSFDTPGGARGLVYVGGVFFEWYGGRRWVARDKGWLKRELWRRLEGSAVVRTMQLANGATQTTTKAYEPTGTKVKDVADAVEADVEMGVARMPRWIGDGEGLPDPEMVMVFADKIVDVAASAKAGQVVASDVGPHWFGQTALTVKLEEGAKCPVWDESKRVWGGGETRWWTLLERYCGATCMPMRKWKKFLVQFGVSNAGKGVPTNEVLPFLLGEGRCEGLKAEACRDLRVLAELKGKDMVTFSDVGVLDRQQRDAFAGVLRSMVGEDRVLTDKKYGGMEGIVLRCMPWIQTHYILDLPNEQGGLMSKMLMLRYRNTMQRPDLRLGHKLRGELPGIAMRFLGAAIELVGAAEGEEWPETEDGRETKKAAVEESNPIDAFLSWGFNRVPRGMTRGEVVKQFRSMWEDAKHVALRKANGQRVTDHYLMTEIETRSSWGLRKKRDQTASGSPWCLEGITARPVAQRVASLGEEAPTTRITDKEDE